MATMQLKTLLTLPLLIALGSPALADANPALLAKCDGMTRSGTIDSKLKDGVIGGFPEKRCALEASIAQKDASIAQSRANIAQSRADIAKLDEILALLNPAEAKAALAQDISKTEQLLKQARERNDQSTAQRYETRLRELKERQKALK
jgi:hypothetical protein